VQPAILELDPGAGDEVPHRGGDEHLGEPLHEVAVARQLPVRLQVREPPHDENEVDVAFAQHLVGDVDVAGAGVADLGQRVVQAPSIPPTDVLD